MPATPHRPNLLFVFTDEQRYDTMACYGNDSIHTPNLNALAEESFVFENAYGCLHITAHSLLVTRIV